MHNSPNTTDNMDAELARKRHRNRFAQQKYRRKLKSHIEELEKRAAVADQLLKANNVHANVLSNNEPLPFGRYSAQLGEHGAAHQIEPVLNDNRISTSSPSRGMADSLQNELSDIQNGHYGIPKDATLMASKPASTMSEEANFFKAFTISEDQLWPKNFQLHDAGNLELQPENIDVTETETANPTARHGSTDTVKAPSLVPSKASPPSVIPRSPHQPIALDSSSLESRVEFVIQSLKKAGFESPDSFVSSYYTSVFRDKSAAKVAQEFSRSKGLPQLLEDLRNKVGSWSTWESSGYKDTIVRLAASMIADEFDRLNRKKYSCEVELQQHFSRLHQASTDVNRGSSVNQLFSLITELKNTLRDELPNLYAITMSLLAQDTPLAQSKRVQLLTATIQIIIASGDEPFQEAAKWVFNRTPPGFMGESGDAPADDFDESAIESF
ncbi:hypothetical protein JX266_008280 [Neoarthrinium moseri]|nr:hypothetical protein JX266_008280 [Neoarthrinium moseri]